MEAEGSIRDDHDVETRRRYGRDSTNKAEQMTNYYR